MRNFALAGMAALSLVATAANADTINNPSNGGLELYWGPSSGGNQSYGEVFVAPQSVMIDYTLSVGSYQADNGTYFPFVSQVYAWDGTQTAGSALYTSGVLQTTSSATTYTFNPGINLVAGGSYIAFVTNQPNGVSLGGSGFGYMTTGVANTGFEFSEGNPAAPGDWYCQACQLSAAFTADFSAGSIGVPEPMAWALMIVGFASVGATLRRRRALIPA